MAFPANSLNNVDVDIRCIVNSQPYINVLKTNKTELGRPGTKPYDECYFVQTVKISESSFRTE